MVDAIVVQENRETISVRDQDGNLPVTISSETISVGEESKPLSVITKAGDKITVEDSDGGLTIEEYKEVIQPQFREVIQIIKQVPAEEEMNYSEQIDFVGDTLIYRGWANPGTATSAPSWRIRRTTFVGADEDVVHEWADGNANFDNIWDNRASYSYS